VTRPQGSACDIGAFELEVVVNQPPVAPDYYTQYWGWPPSDPDFASFTVPVQDPEGGSLTIVNFSQLDISLGDVDPVSSLQRTQRLPG
jgi:hypothetical protein